MHSEHEESKLSNQQINTLARHFLYHAADIFDFYRDPAREAAFQEWHISQYGYPAPPLE